MPSTGAPLASRFRPWWTGALLCALALACYWPALHGTPLWDDQAHLTTPELQSLAGLKRIWFELGATQQYYPLLHSAFWIEHRLWGDATFGYHLFNVLLHATAATLFVLILRRLSIPGATLAGLIFVVHPVSVESVAWISEQKNTLSLVLYLLAVLAYLRSEDDRSRTNARWWYLGATLLFVCALLCKSVTATLPAALLVLAWWRRGRLAWRVDVLPLLPWFAIALASGLFTAWVEHRFIIGAEFTQFDLTLVQRVLLASRMIWFYLGKLFWPAPLIFFYPRWDVASSPLVWSGCLLAVAAVTFALWRFRQTNRGPLAAWLFFVGSLFPALGFFNIYPFLFSYVADHFQYLACLGVIAGASAGFAPLLTAAPVPWRTLGWIFGGTAIATFAFLSHAQSRLYTDLDTLYRTTIARNPDSWVAHNNLGAHLLAQKSPASLAEAVTHFQTALRLKPDYVAAHYNLGKAYFEIPGHLADAVAEDETALRLRPNYPEAHNNLGNALALIPGRLADAVAHYEEALREKPGQSETYFNLGNALLKIPGRRSDAAVQFQTTVRLKPDHANAHNNLGLIWSETPGRTPDALVEFETAVRFQPDYAEAHYNLANTLQNIPGRLSDALAHYEMALRLQPNDADFHNNYGGVLLKVPGRSSDAIAQFETAVRLSPDYAKAHYNLAVALLRVPGRQRDARLHAESFARLWSDHAQARQFLATFEASLPPLKPISAER